MKKIIFISLLIFASLAQGSGYTSSITKVHRHGSGSSGGNQIDLSGGFTYAPGQVMALAPNSSSYFAFKADGTSNFDNHGLEINTRDTGVNKIGNIRFSRNSVARWTIKKDDVAEGGSNAGSDLCLQGHSDAGASLGCWLTLKRSSGKLTSTKPCAANYTRRAPNFCASSLNYANTALTRDSCVTVAAPHADAVSILLSVSASATSANSVALRQTTVYAYTDNTCATIKRALAIGTGYEFNAIAAGTGFGTSINESRVDVDGSDNVYLKMTDDAGNEGLGTYFISGYYD